MAHQEERKQYLNDVFRFEAAATKNIMETQNTINKKNIKELFEQHPNTAKIVAKLTNATTSHLHLQGLLGSSIALLITSVLKQLKEINQNSQCIIILPDKESAAYMYNDLTRLIGETHSAFFPTSYKRSVQYQQIDTISIQDRTEVLNQLKQTGNTLAVATYPEALIEKVISRKEFSSNTLSISKGDEFSTDFIVEVLQEYKFQRVDFVYQPGQYSIRGSIIDIFSFSNQYPFRLDFFGDEIDSIRIFNPENQLSIKKLEKIEIIPDIQSKKIVDERHSFFDFVTNNTTLWIYDTGFLIDRIREIYNNSVSKFSADDNLSANDLLITGNKLPETLNKFTTLEFGNKPYFQAKPFLFHTSKQPRFQKNFDILRSTIREKSDLGYTTCILSENEKQIHRLQTIFKDLDAQDTSIENQSETEFTPVKLTVHEGFIDNDLKVCCFTDHQIFDRYHKFRLKSSKTRSGKEALTIKELQDLHPGDYVVHADHGIGVFGGLEKIDINGKKQEAIRLVYRDNDILLVNIHSLHRISKYKGKEGTQPKIYKLGSNAWQRLKNRTKKKVKDIARQLIKLYAKRKKETGYQFAQDTYLQHELESSFIYEDTPDQTKATFATKNDMEQHTPMDRLICGDVGFGKTEIAIRAAFKAVTDSKQVAVLVPTTILALQHYHTFSERLKEFPCNIDYISRLKSAKQQRETLKNLSEGKVDILIGTHRIVSKDIKFKDLGLLVVDEEQKFGVAVKEKLRELKVNVDTLTLTATPIPRTLQFSLMGARDLSIIATPPPNRYPIATEVHTFDHEIIREAINYELERNGQVFFIHNRVQNILEVETMVKRLCPDARTVVGHGQMRGPQLEKVMLDFINGDYDILVATTIIENGLDIPNANTIIINEAHRFGLSDLHQLRGRVGRSNKKAFCFLLAPPVTNLPMDTRRRLKAIEDFSELGSGFNIALQDLDIRGAGNLLGGEQSGFIADIGFETYHRILDEAMLELREEEFKDLFVNDAKEADDENQKTTGRAIFEKETHYVTDCTIETDIELLFPDSYIESISERMNMYRELDNIKDEETLKQFEENLIDRFGKIPPKSKELIQVVKLRWKAMDLGIEKIILKNNKMTNYFVSNQKSSFYQTECFQNIIRYIQDNPKKCTLRQTPNKLMLSFHNVSSVKQAINHLLSVKEYQEKYTAIAS